ncbi:hypothetical protein H2201_006716 [Coniosporium apollinis]|uniref:2EXR domain-containing protein n=2 Tax=Coniosporium TaxID=2810619 RepID=A0ABQ9NSV8_9PEZI|nr:hypothetical protein H2199_005371 [Cladosporium sp. JES 115]KAJ9660988.1 hypothetical protein H2201_006716 [Coniosporium apollinis]
MTSSNGIMNQQYQSPLLRLPAEIRNMIYRFALTADSPIVDPTILHPADEEDDNDDDREIPISRNRSIPALGTALLQTCRLIREEADVRTLYSNNTFAFTSITTAHFFLTSLSPTFSPMVQDIEIDARNMGTPEYGLCYEFIAYLSARSNDYFNQYGSLWKEAPELKILRFNFSSWPTIPGKRDRIWTALLVMLSNVSCLERVVVIGASKGYMETIEPWHAAHFAGTDCPTEHNSLVEKLCSAVGKRGCEGSEDDRFVRWSRTGGLIELEALSKDYVFTKKIQRRGSSITNHQATDPWPANECCTLAEFRVHSVAKVLFKSSPTASE